MRKFQLLDIKLIDLDTFKYFNGAEEFENEFKHYAESKFEYKFYNYSEAEEAEKLLLKLNLHYNKFYGTEVESDEDIITHPAFYIIFSANYKTAVKEENTFFINSKKMGKKNFQTDMDEDFLIMTKKGMEFFKNEIPEVKFEKILDTTKKTEYYKVIYLPELDFPIIYKKALELKEFRNFKNEYSIKSDGRTDLEDDAIKEIKKNKLLKCKTFKLGEKIYPNVFSLTLISGELAFKIKQNFNLKEEGIYITPIILDQMEE